MRRIRTRGERLAKLKAQGAPQMAADDSAAASDAEEADKPVKKPTKKATKKSG